MRRLLIVPIAAVCLSFAGPALAGQPNASCEDAGATPPPGFSTGGFATAEAHYAGSDGTPSAGEREQRTRFRSTTSPASRGRSTSPGSNDEPTS